MNKEVNFEIAKLLKDKEFMDKNMYGEVRLSHPKFYDSHGVIHNIKDAFEKTELNLKECYNAPSITEVVMWLYEKHGIWIYIKQSTARLGFRCFIQRLNTLGEEDIQNDERYTPSEEAYEAGIKYALEILIQGGNK